MNLKPNLWTLLFLLAASGWAYSYMYPSTASSVSDQEFEIFLDDRNLFAVEKRVGFLDDTISKDQYNADRAYYLEHIHAPLDSLFDEIQKDGKIDLSFPLFFKLESNEIAQLHTVDSSDVYVSLVVEGIDSTGNFGSEKGVCQKGMSLIFSTEPPIEYYKEDEGNLHFNFATPCPPLCDTVPGKEPRRQGREYFCEYDHLDK